MWLARRVVPWMVVLMLTAAGPASGAGAQLRVGAAEEKITPPRGMPLAGYYSERPASGVHDDLFAKAIYLADGKTEIAWVACDIIGLNRGAVLAARRLITERTGIPGDHVLLSATHTHTGPLYTGPMPGVYEVERENLTPMQAKYMDDLAGAIAAAVVRARERAADGRVEVATAQEDSLSFNRRYHMKGGDVRFNPGRLNPNIVRAAGPIDPRVVVLALQPGNVSAPGDAPIHAPIAAVVSFALHCDTTGGTSVSADFPFYLQQKLRGRLADRVVSIYAQGCCGDINHIDVSKAAPPKSANEAERLGGKLGDDVLAALKNAHPVAELRLAALSALVDLPLQSYTQDDLTSARTIIANGKRPFLETVQAYKVQKLDQLQKPSLRTEVQVLRIADVAVVGLPGEIFVELGLWIREKSPFPTTIVTELSNDSIGYVPTKKAFTEGSYEVTNSLIAPGGGEHLAEKAVELLHQLHK